MFKPNEPISFEWTIDDELLAVLEAASNQLTDLGQDTEELDKWIERIRGAK